MLDFDDRDGVRGRDENRLRFVRALNALGASVLFCFSSSDPLRMLFVGREGKCETLDEDEAADTDGERETEAASVEALPFGDEWRFMTWSRRLTQLLSRCRSNAGRLAGSRSSPCSSCSTTTTGRLSVG